MGDVIIVAMDMAVTTVEDIVAEVIIMVDIIVGVIHVRAEGSLVRAEGFLVRVEGSPVEDAKVVT